MSEGEAERLVARRWGLPDHAARLATEKDDTFAIHGDDHRGYILKVTNPAEDPLEVDLEVQLMSHVARAGTVVPVPRLFPDRDGHLLTALMDTAGHSRHARLMSLIAGAPLDSTWSSPAQLEEAGRTLANLRHLPRLRPLVEEIADPGWGQLRWFRDQPDEHLAALLARNGS